MGMKKAQQAMKKRKVSDPLTVRATSRKQGPVIRVVQVLAPLVVQADESNFCSLVQRLTGKQSAAMATSQDQSSSPTPPSLLSSPSPSPSGYSSSPSSSSEEDNHHFVKIQPDIQNITSFPFPCSVPSDLSDHMIPEHQHALHHHSDHFSFSLINDTALSPPTCTSSAGFYVAESDNSDDDHDTPSSDYFDYHHLIDLPPLPEVLDQEAERWLENSFINACLDQN